MLFRKPTLSAMFFNVVALGLTSDGFAQNQSLVQIDAQMLDSVPTTKVLVAELTGDDHSDVVGLRFDSTTGVQNRIVIQRQVPSAGSDPLVFETTQVLPAIFPQDIELADVDADGDLDLMVVQDSADDALTIWTNMGNRQQGTPGQFRRSTTRFTLNLASAVRTLKLAPSGSNPRDVLLVGSLGRPSLLYETRVDIQSPPSFELIQTILHPGAIAATIGDLNADGRDDIVMFGTSTQILINQGTALDPMVAVAAPALAGIGTVFAASLRDLDGDADLDLILGSSSGDLVFRHDGLNANNEPQFVLSQSLGAGTLGVSRGYAWIDADGDGIDELVAARTTGSTPTTTGGSLVYQRSGINFTPAPIQRLSVAETLVTAPLTFNTAPHLWLASRHSELNDIWRSELSPPMIPVASLVAPPPGLGASGYFIGSRVGAPINVTPATQTDTSLQMELLGDAIAPIPFSTTLPPGHSHSLVPVTIPPGTGVRFWIVELNAVLPAGAATIGSTDRVSVVTLPDPPGGGDLGCYITCLFVGVCDLPRTLDSAANTSGTGLLMGSADEVTMLQRLRDERMSTSSGGRYYVDLYQSLQFDLYQATFADPTFYLDLWQLKNAWMPAVVDLVDGNGSSVITSTMRDQLLAVLLRFETHGSVALQQAIARERISLNVAGLAGQPIAALQHRWESSPVFSDGFE